MEKPTAEQPYSKYTSDTKLAGTYFYRPTKVKNNFDIPFDKLYFTLKDKIEFSVEDTSLLRPIPGRTGFRTVADDCFSINSHGILVTSYRSHAQSNLQINPTHWDSYQGIELFLRVLMGDKYKNHYITRMHGFIDMPVAIEDVKRSAWLKRTKSERFFTDLNFVYDEEIYAGSIVKASCTAYHGSKRTRVDCIYDSSKRHGLPVPSTRIESRLNDKRFIPINRWEELPSLLTKSIFNRIELRDFVSTSSLKPKDRYKLKLIQLLINQCGLKGAEAELRKQSRSHFKRDFGHIFAMMTTMSALQPDHWFRPKLEKFISADISEREKDFIGVFSVGPPVILSPIATSKLTEPPNMEK